MTAFDTEGACFPENEEKWHRIKEAIDSAKRVFITSHVNPDGDALGSEMALAGFLAGYGKPVRVLNQSVTPELYEFLDTDGFIETFDGDGVPQDCPDADDLIFFLDMGNYNRIGSEVAVLAESKAWKVVIDHHVYDGIEADIVVVDPTAAATASLVYDLCHTINDGLLTAGIAEALLTGIITDTGYFSYSNTTPTTLRIAARLYECGTSTRDIRRKLESGFPIAKQKLLGMTLSNLSLADNGRIAYSFITSDMFDTTGASREHTDGIIEQVKLVKGIHVAVLIIQENNNTFKASFRSMSGVPVSEIARSLGGGGHVKAAGATVQGSLEEVRSRIIDVVSAHIDNEK